jgi:tetratricopeptide (TPR) repeat protein
MAYREFGDAAEKDLREALRLDPSNVFANAMLGNWLMQTGGSTEEAIAHFRTAVAQNSERPFVRKMQLAQLISSQEPEIRTELMRVANEMRRNGEPLDSRQRNGILNASNPTINSEAEVRQSLSAIPPEDAWATYLWVDHDRGDDTGDYRRMRQDYIHAEILELEGKRQEALAAFEKLRGELKQRGFNGRIVSHVETALKRLSTP